MGSILHIGKLRLRCWVTRSKSQGWYTAKSGFRLRSDSGAHALLLFQCHLLKAVKKENGDIKGPQSQCLRKFTPSFIHPSIIHSFI